MHKIILPIVVILLIAIGFIVARDIFLGKYANSTTERVTVKETVVEKTGCDESCKQEIADQVALAVASLSASPTATTAPKPVAVSAPLATAKPEDSYIQISGSGSTQNTEWTDVTGSDFSFDVNQDFSKGASFAWEGFLRITDANGTAYARIYDVTHSIGVNGSDISIINKADFTRANSNNMNFWAGRNTYRVQIRSLNTVNVDYMGGKIRISH